MFWVIDADAEVTEEFMFDYIPDVYDKEVVHVWGSKNPVNGLEYGYGGAQTISLKWLDRPSSWGIDFTTGLSSRFNPRPVSVVLLDLIQMLLVLGGVLLENV